MVTFGGWKEDFMLVVNKTTQKGSGQSELGTERLLFVMPRGKVYTCIPIVCYFLYMHTCVYASVMCIMCYVYMGRIV